MAKIPFTNNYVDLSSNRGFQFKFHCQKCGNGYMSTFQTNTLARRHDGRAGRLQSLRRHARTSGAVGPGDRAGGRGATTRCGAHEGGRGDRADLQAVHPLRPVGLRAGVLEQEAGLCENCAPDLDEEISAAQAQAAKAQAIEKAREVDYLGQRDLTQRAAVACPQCGARTQGGKFCPECGATISPKKQCAQCGAEADGSPKFCPECGTPYGA